MPESDGFLRRWSRRKQEETPPDPEGGPDEPVPARDVHEAASEEAPEEIDLPSVDTLGADSDFSVFMRKGVSKAIQSAALRRAWVTKPEIVGHRPLVEYAWDFNAPGYGALRATDDVAGAVASMAKRYLTNRPAPEPEVADEEGVVVAQAPTFRLTKGRGQRKSRFPIMTGT